MENKKVTSPLCNYVVIKKDGTKEAFDMSKIRNAVLKSAERVMVKFTADEFDLLYKIIEHDVLKVEGNQINIKQIHNIVELALERVNPLVSKAYKDYRNYKTDFVHMLDKVYQESQKIMYLGDKSNANADSALVTTKRSLIFNELSKQLYRNFFLNN